MFCLTLLPDEVFIEFARLLDVGNCLGGWLFDLCVGSGGVRGVMFYCLFVYLFVPSRGRGFSSFLFIVVVVWFTLLNNVGFCFSLCVCFFPIFVLQVFLCFQCVHLPRV